MPTFSVTTNLKHKGKIGVQSEMPLCAIVSAPTAEDALSMFARDFQGSLSAFEGWKPKGMCRATEVYYEDLLEHGRHSRRKPVPGSHLTLVKTV